VDDRSRVAFSQLLPDESAATAALFLIEAASFFTDHGVVIQRVLTDNAKAYAQSILFAETAATLGITLKRTRQYRPRPTASPSGSTRPCSRSGPMRGPIAPTPTAIEPSAAGCGPTIGGNHTSRFDGLTPMAVLVNNLGGNHATMDMKVGRLSGVLQDGVA
jgi:hypothetical protein